MDKKIPFGVLLRVVQYVIVGAALAWVTVLELSPPSTGKHRGPAKWIVLSLALLIGFLGPLDSLWRTVSEWWGTASWTYSLKVEETIKGLLVGLSRTTPIPWTAIGLTVFVLRRSRRHPLRGVQHRVARLRMEGKPRPTSIAWSWRKGLLGRCWEERQDVDRDHQSFYAPFRRCTKAQWKGASEQVTERLTFEDFKSIREFGYVLASPILRDGKYRGCLVVQVDAIYASHRAEGTDARKLIWHAADAIAQLDDR